MLDRSFAHYRIVRKLGEGGMGQVFVAEDLKLDREVALKFLPDHISRDSHALERFVREAKAAAAVHHPNIIAVHEIGTFEDKQYIAMAYVEGESLAEVLRSRRLSIGSAVDIACQVCDGLGAAHRTGILHRDIKPDNIHVDHNKHVRILDFGLAVRDDWTRITGHDVAVGTITYMSPEQSRGERLDQRSDLFSLGTVVYEMLAGQVPFQGPVREFVVHAIRDLPHRPVRELNPAVNEALAKVVDKALEKDPARRFASAEDMLSALRRAGGSAARVTRIKRRHRRTLMWGSVVLLLGVAAGIVIPKLLPGPDRAVAGSMAVLPFDNLSGDPGQIYFVDGMTDAIITRLAQIKALKVISKTSAMQYRDTDKPLKQIARELNVTMIVEGAVIRSGNKVQITAQLIDVPTDNHLWAESFSEVDVSDVIALQSRVASEIAQQVSVHVTSDERDRLRAAIPAHPEAYESYLQGRFYFNRRTPPDIARAVDYFKRAIEIDPDFAPALAGIADCYTVRAMWNWDTSQNTFPLARHACERALQIDPKLAEAHTSLAMVELFYDWNWEAAEVRFKKAIELNPNYATAYHWYGLSLLSLGRYDDAIKRMKQACELDPFAPIMLVSLSQAYDLNGQYDLATKAVERAFTLFPEFGYAWLAKSWIAFHQQRYAETVNCARTAMRLRVNRSEVMLVAGLDGLGRKAAADSVLTEALASEQVAYHVRAALYAYHNMPDSALAMTRKAIDAREWFVVAFRSRWLEPMHRESAFDELLKTKAPIKGVD